MNSREKKIIFLAGIFCAVVFVSCSSKSSAYSLTSTLDEADRYIAQGYPADALKVLAKAQKKIYSPMEAVGIYKRYAALSETKSAEKILVKSLKKFPENIELNAVYCAFLKSQNRFEEAFKRAEILKGTPRYASLYSELFLRNVLAESGENRSAEFFLGEDFIPIYYGAYSISADNAWLRNAALLHLAMGEYEAAANLVPEKMKGASDAYFWSTVLYDAAQYGEAAECLLQADKLLKKKEVALSARSTEIAEKVSVGGIEIAALLSDCYVNMGEDDAAEKARGDLIARITLGKEESPSDLLGVMYLNSALYSQERDDQKAAFKLLSFVVQQWQDFTPALIAYGNFAYESARRVLDDPLTQALREAGVVSADMKRFDELPRVAVSDALLRMKESLVRTKDENLYVAMLDLEEKSATKTDDRERLSKVWHILERNAISTNLYPPAVMQYALYSLLKLEQYSEAKNLFKKYLEARYGFSGEQPFEEYLANNVQKMLLWETEYAAYFAAVEKNADLAKRLYEYAVYEYGFAPERIGKEISLESAVQSAVNLAMIYSSMGNKEKALELYGRAGGRAVDSYLKSEIMYRIANIYNGRGNKKEALRSLEYGMYLNPSNGRARLLHNEIKETSKNF